jgi:UDP-glucuronate 4-epimerase
VKILVTGTAGFIGFHLTERLLAQGHTVLGIDAVNTYYDVRLKHARLARLGLDVGEMMPGRRIQSRIHPQLAFIQLALEDGPAVERALADAEFDVIAHLAAQAGVRASLTTPRPYIDSNIHGFQTILELSRRASVRHTVYASSSSVYGERSDPPFRETDPVGNPVSLYAVTKRTNELMASCHADLFGLRLVGLRFFTVYGPLGRPDMAYFDFARRIFAGEPIAIHNRGDMARDFTCVRDTVEGLLRVVESGPVGPDRHAVYNLGRGAPVRLLDFVDALERACGRRAERHLLPMHPGDVTVTWAAMDRFATDYGFTPAVSLEEGVGEFVAWFRAYHGLPQA